MVGRYVTVVIPEEKKTLTLCEVEVYGTSVLGMWTSVLVFNLPRILNLPFSNVRIPQKYIKTTENLTVHYGIMYATTKFT